MICSRLYCQKNGPFPVERAVFIDSPIFFKKNHIHDPNHMDLFCFS